MADAPNDAILQELKRIIENDKVFISPEFVSFYSRLIFSKKNDPHIQKAATLLCKEFKNFLQVVEKRQKELHINLISLNQYEKKIVELIHKCVDIRVKILDGDVALDKFKSLVCDDPVLSSVEGKGYVDKYTSQEVMTTDLMETIESRYVHRKCLYSSLEQYEMLWDFLMNGYKECQSWNEFLENFNGTIHTAITNIAKVNTLNRSTLSRMSDLDPSDLVESTKASYRIPTGFRVLDYAFNGGFEPRRVYMFGGISGGGKSLVLVNLAYKAKIALDRERREKNITDEKWGVLYLTLENGVDETVMRFLCCNAGMSKRQMLGQKMIGNTDAIEKAYNRVFKVDNGTEMLIYWQPPSSVSSLDTMSILHDIERSMDIKVKMIFIDYADKMKPLNPNKTGQEWIDLGSIIDELKAMAVECDIPVATVTQVNRDSYKDGPNGGSIAGSIRKKENADVLIMFDFHGREETVIDDTVTVEQIMAREDKGAAFVPIMGYIDKNRDGPSNIRFKCYIDYSSYRFADHVNAGNCNPLESPEANADYVDPATKYI